VFSKHETGTYPQEAAIVARIRAAQNG